MKKEKHTTDNQYFLVCDVLNPDQSLYHSYLVHFDMVSGNVTVNYPTEEFTMKCNSLEGKTVKEWVMETL